MTRRDFTRKRCDEFLVIFPPLPSVVVVGSALTSVRFPSCRRSPVERECVLALYTATVTKVLVVVVGTCYTYLYPGGQEYGVQGTIWC